ncbi:YceD family protein [Pseudohoeflea coraliihabitans]|uniref:DUF177 domain-containing protein n=1 Tax=Pseudohoeflea coraliihabitans TaxID=2860393 RepID=A0ABS6WT10_9HYPH|nr:DUF177 domain-containing protein [Pseudohoeflea sp. DP4N28-3]MBW3098778.1 DUF177 domain-containing protein [Pseudohoeflea sp. DP4N28-3]
MTRTDNDGTADPAFSFTVNVGRIAANPVQLTFAAEGSELRRLATVWGVDEVEAFSGTAAVSRWKRDGVRVKGRVEATVVQPCVVSLEPVRQDISEAFETLFVPENSRLARIELESGEMVIDAEGPDLPETFGGDRIDIGAVAAEYAALAIDPYPRRDDAAFQGHIESDPDRDEKISPFAVLKSATREDPTGENGSD